MKIKAAFLAMLAYCIIGLFWSCGTQSNKGTADVSLLFKQQCALCHGIDGKLGLNGAKDFAVATSTLEERVEIITNGKGKMLAYGNKLSKDQIKAFAEYTMKLGSK